MELQSVKSKAILYVVFLVFIMICFSGCSGIGNSEDKSKDSLGSSGKNLENLELPEIIGSNFLDGAGVDIMNPSKADGGEEKNADNPNADNSNADDLSVSNSGSADDQTAKESYCFINQAGNTLSERFNPPEGFTRTEADGFGAFLRDYPLLPHGSEVLLYDGSVKWIQEDHAAVFDMDLVPGDLQQCADSCIRLYAEYLYGKGSYDKIAFHLVNGFLVDFDTWRKGGRVAVNGNNTEWVMNGEVSDSKEVFEKYLKFVFTYASTLSMDKESNAIDIDEMKAGDLFIRGGSPGHVVMVLDVCENEKGEKAFLLGQGFMPAQQFHVLKNPAYEEDPWYYVSEVEYPFQTPEYVFDEGSFKRPVYDMGD